MADVVPTLIVSAESAKALSSSSFQQNGNHMIVSLPSLWLSLFNTNLGHHIIATLCISIHFSKKNGDLGDLKAIVISKSC